MSSSVLYMSMSLDVLLGAGRPLFEGLAEHTELELTRVVDAPGVTHLRFRVKA